MTEVTLTELRKDLFRLADQALETGEPVVVLRKGRRLLLQPETVSTEAGVDRWARYVAWCEEQDGAGDCPGDDTDVEAALAQVSAAGVAEWRAEWEAFDRHEAELSRLEAEGRWDEFYALVERGH